MKGKDVVGEWWSSTMQVLNVPSFAVRMVAGAGLGALRAGARTTTTAAGTALAVASPVVGVGRSVADGVLAIVQRDASVAWSSGRRLHLDLAQLVPTTQAVGVTTEVVAAVSKVPGGRAHPR